MKITVVYGNNKKETSTTYQIVKKVIQKLVQGDQVWEFFMPDDMPHFCRGCCTCMSVSEEKCPEFQMIKPITQAMEESELLIFASPVYAFHVSAQLKALLDHLSYAWMSHRPHSGMFSKQALIVTTAAGAGTKHTIKDIQDSLDYWGVAKVYHFKKAVAAGKYSEVNDKMREEIEQQVNRLVRKIEQGSRRVKPRLKVKALFYFMRMMNKTWAPNPVDVSYWKEKGWLDKERPWKR